MPYSLTVQWDAPANNDKFDLEYYTIQVLSSEVGNLKGRTLNVTGSELEYPFGLIMNSSFPQYELSNLTVSAVSKCSHQGPEASATITSLNLGLNTPMDVNNSTVTDNFKFTTTVVKPGSNGNACMHSQSCCFFFLLSMHLLYISGAILQAMNGM